MAAIDVNLQVEREGGIATGDSSGTVGFGSDEIDGDGEVDFANEVGEEDECAGGHADKHGRRGMAAKVGGDLGGKVGDSARDFVFAPQDSLYVGMHRNERHSTGFTHSHREIRKGLKGVLVCLLH